MKLILPLVLICQLINLSFGDINYYINFIPYDNLECSGAVTGIGYSILEYSCFSIDVAYSYQLTTKGNGNGMTIDWFQFPRDVGKTLCYYQGLPLNNVTVGSCIKTTGQSIFDIHRQPSTTSPQQYYLVTISKLPYYPTQSGTTVFQYMGNGKCSNDNVEIIQYFTNNTQSESGDTGIQMNWYCDATNKPMEKQCFNGENCVPLPQQYTCKHIHPFFNSSSEVSGGTGAGGYSGSGSGSSSGNSGSSGNNSGSSSGNILIDILNKNINNKNNNNNNNNIKINNLKSSSTTGGDSFNNDNDDVDGGSSEGNYLTSFCT